MSQRFPFALCTPPSSASPADTSASSYTWPYTRSVIAGSWPSHFAAAVTAVPLWSIRVAAVCRVSCNRMTGTPAAAQWRRKALEYVSGRIGKSAAVQVFSLDHEIDAWVDLTS
jgi:hypothetical protein